MKAFVLSLLIFVLFNEAQAQQEPAGLVITKEFANRTKTLYFCPNGNFQMTEDVYPEKSIFQGTWVKKGEVLLIHVTLNYGERGIGEKWEVNGESGYNEYKEFIYEINDTMQINWKNFQIPDSTIKIVRHNYLCPTQLYHPRLPGKYPIASYKLLKEEDLQHYKPEELEIMSKEVAARYGQIFIMPTDKEYFMSQSWYFPEKESVKSYLTNIEKRNVRTISAYLRKLRY
jgi:hypothetical protein